MKCFLQPNDIRRFNFILPLLILILFNCVAQLTILIFPFVGCQPTGICLFLSVKS